MEYLKNTPIRFTAPKGGWPTDWPESPQKEEIPYGPLEKLIYEGPALQYVSEGEDPR